VAIAAEGGRNERLNEAAFALGTLVGAGVLNHFDAENALFDAAMLAGLGEGETQGHHCLWIECRGATPQNAA
jgi:hypothetical protein